MSVRSSEKTPVPAMDISELNAGTDSLAEGNSYCVANPENPLKRTICVSIKTNLNQLCLQKSKGTWQPTPEALRTIFQQRKFTSLEGSAEPMGDLKVPVPAAATRR